MKIGEGKVNRYSIIQCLQQPTQTALFQLRPVTGKTHQLRLHMQTISFPIFNDKYYLHLQALSEDNYSSPLQ